MKLFDVITANPHSDFELVRTHPTKAIAQRMMEDTFATFKDPDGNFVEQFQSSGFDARVFELYLHAAFTERGMSIERQEAPDFILDSGGVRFALEATTSHPSTSGALLQHGTAIADLDVPGRKQYIENEWPIRMGGPLFTKLKKRDWEKPDCKGLPFVLAIEAFHDRQAIFLSHVGFENYLYGRNLVDPKIVNGRLVASVHATESHSVGPKTIPSGFFYQPETENISAIIFSNTGTLGKFTRMGYARYKPNIDVGFVRSGALRNAHPEIRHATYFTYDLRAPLLDEKWTDGMIIMHNPNAINPLPRHAFDGIAQVWGHECHESFPDNLVYVSHTLTITQRSAHPITPLVIEGIPREEGRALAAIPLPEIVTTDYWFSDPKRACLGLVTQDTEEPSVWRAWRLLRGTDRLFYPNSSRVFSYEQEAVDYIQEWLAALLFRTTDAVTSPEYVPFLFPLTFKEYLDARKETEPK